MKEHCRHLIRRVSCAKDYWGVAALYGLSRWAFRAVGLKFEPELSWMFLADPVALRQRPLETILYFHAFPPGMNVHTAALLQFGEAHFALLAQLSFLAFGLTLVLAIFYLGKALGLGRRTAALLSLAFACAPPALLFENLYLYTLPSAALLALAAALFHRALKRPSTVNWLGFFTTCSVLGWYRSTFHLLWFGVVLLGSWLWCSRAGRGKAVLLGAAAPAALLTAVYLKNLALFGVFGATSWGGANLVAVTTRQMPPHELKQWIREGKTSPLSAINVFAPPAAYAKHIAVETYPWPGSNEWVKPSNGAPNYNHGLFLVANPLRKQDSAYYIRQRPTDYLRVVSRLGVPQFFSPSTLWHPGERRDNSPHAGHHAALGSYETSYNWVLHAAIPGLAPVGLYALVPLVVLAGMWHGLEAWRCSRREASDDARAQACLWWFLVFQVVFVTSVSCLFALGESARYRFMVEANIWLLTAAVVHRISVGLRADRP